MNRDLRRLAADLRDDFGYGARVYLSPTVEAARHVWKSLVRRWRKQPRGLCGASGEPEHQARAAARGERRPPSWPF